MAGKMEDKLVMVAFSQSVSVGRAYFSAMELSCCKGCNIWLLITRFREFSRTFT